MAASRIGWGQTGRGDSLALAKILHRAGIATALALLCALAAPTAPAQAQNTGIYTVRGVPVDATADNAAQAREKALAEGQQEALGRLLERLTPVDAHGRLPQPSPAEVEDMVLGLSLDDEKTSDVRYLATMTVSFMPQAVHQLLEKAGVPFVDEPAPTLVVLPVWRSSPESRPVLWEDPNPWRRAWGTLARDGLQPIETPLGDLEDVIAIDAARASGGDADALQTLADRYAAQGTLVAEATLQPGTDGAAPTIQVTATHNGAPYGVSIQPGAEESLDEALARAARAVRARLEAAWTARRAAGSLDGPANTMTAIVPVTGLQGWLEVRRALDDAPGIDAWTLQALTRDRAQISLAFQGTPPQLAQALAPYGLKTTPNAGYWVIERGLAATSAPGAVAPDQGQVFQSPSRQGVTAVPVGRESGSTGPESGSPADTTPWPATSSSGSARTIGGGVTAPQ